MEVKYIKIDDELIALEPVCEEKGNVLYKYEPDGRINSAPLKEVLNRFPSYRPKREDLFCDFLFEENGTLVVYEPDGTVADPFEMITEEEINKIE